MRLGFMQKYSDPEMTLILIIQSNERIWSHDIVVGKSFTSMSLVYSPIPWSNNKCKFNTNMILLHTYDVFCIIELGLRVWDIV